MKIKFISLITATVVVFSMSPALAGDVIVKGGIAVVALENEPDVLDPTLANTFISRVVFTSLCEKLYDVNDKLQLIPQLAAALPITSADGLTMDIKLRKGIKFNDGTPFDANAVKVTLDRDKTMKTSARRPDLAAVDKVEVVNPLAVRLTLNKPYSPLVAQLADRAGMIMSPTALAKLGDNFGTAPVCVGPFKFKNRVAGSEINLVKSDQYYDANKVNLDGIKYKFITDANVRAANLRSGDVNVAERLNPSDAIELQKLPAIKILGVATLAYQGLTINVDPTKTNSALAKSVQLRKAFELSLDRKAINDVVFNGQNVPDCLPISTTSPFRPTSVTCSAFDPNAARKIVQASGEKLPIPFDLMIPAGADSVKLGEVIQSMANAVGFKVTVKPVEFLTSLTAGRAGKFDVYLIGWSGRIDPDGNLTGLVTTGGPNNFSQSRDPVLDALISKAASFKGLNQRKGVYTRVFARLAQTVPNIYLYHDKWFLGLSGITGVDYFGDALPRFKTASMTK